MNYVLDALIIVLLPSLPLAFPSLYIFLKKGNKKLLFIFANYGGSLIIYGLCYLISAPFVVFLFKVAPSLAEQGGLDHILWLLYVMDFLGNYGMILVIPLVNIGLPILLYRRYDFLERQ